MSTPTPRTDAAFESAWKNFSKGWTLEMVDFAKTLETELTAALARIAELEMTLEGAYGETTHLRSRNAEQKRLIDCANQYMPGLLKGSVSVESLTRQLSEAQAQLATLRESNAVLQSQVDNRSLALFRALNLGELGE